MSVSELEAKTESFLEEITNNIISAQKNVAHTAMKELFDYSPHYCRISTEERSTDNEEDISNRIKSISAEGEYDANHKVLINNQSMTNHNNPTHSYVKSRTLHAKESRRIDNVSNIGDKITITNDTDHALEVETGYGWSVPAYHTYTVAKEIITHQYKDVLT